MNYITETFNSKSSNVPKTPGCERLLPEDVESPTIAHCGSWKSRMFAKVKECRDAIRSMIAFDKPPATIEAALSNDANSREQSNFFESTRAASASSAASSDAQRSRNKRTLIRTSTLNSNEMRELNAMIERIDDTCNPNDSSNDCLDNTTSSSLRSFLILERRVAEEFSEEDAAAIIAAATKACSEKKKISAEPFLSYAQGSAEFVWSEDTEDSVSERAWNSLERSNSSDIEFENPRTSSTFCEYLYETDKCSTPAPKLFVLQDSGFEPHFSV